MGRIHFQYDWDWQGTEAEYKRAIALNPNLASSYSQYAFFLQALGRQQEALAAAHRAVELDPLSAPNICDEGRILYRARQYENAVALYQRALELEPGYRPALIRVVEAFERLANYDEALKQLEKWQQETGNQRLGLRPLAAIDARMGKRREAVDALRTIEKDSIPGDGCWLIDIYSSLGDRDCAIEELEKAVHARSILPFIFIDPKLDPLRSDARFQQLLRQSSLFAVAP